MFEAYELHPESFTSSVSERKALPMAWWESRLEKDAVFGAWDNNELIGVVGLSFESCEKIRHKATLFGLYILPRLRYHGIGLRLI
ncbi:hypothetical protein GCM10009425_25710 [Pseudomonas asuensis]|uniref:N-acetyltransferase domain-containing protein n=1 Tax=Pseudomonas asuensis TaxID=1825787 RepID=A0ABQ2GVT0_9PSED|nr:hypothetical protein GCM10009425_25710 [Pseudomonas asuensis]